jgi:hypothetical protein
MTRLDGCGVGKKCERGLPDAVIGVVGSTSTLTATTTTTTHSTSNIYDGVFIEVFQAD